MVYSIDELKQKIKPVALKYNLSAVYIFGSYARNEACDDSDVDILVDRSGSSVRGFGFGALYNDLCDCIGKDVDLVTTQTLEQDSTKQRTPWFVENLMRERMKIYEAQ